MWWNWTGNQRFQPFLSQLPHSQHALHCMSVSVSLAYQLTSDHDKEEFRLLEHHKKPAELLIELAFQLLEQSSRVEEKLKCISKFCLPNVSFETYLLLLGSVKLNLKLQDPKLIIQRQRDDEWWWRWCLFRPNIYLDPFSDLIDHREGKFPSRAAPQIRNLIQIPAYWERSSESWQLIEFSCKSLFKHRIPRKSAAQFGSSVSVAFRRLGCLHFTQCNYRLSKLVDHKEREFFSGECSLFVCSRWEKWRILGS